MNRSDVTERVMLFDSYLSGNPLQREFHRSVIKNGKKFVAHIESDRIRFIPGHYATVPIDQMQHLVQRQTVADFDTALRLLLGAPLAPGEPLYEAIDRAYRDYCALSSDTPSAHRQARTYWLCRPDEVPAR